MSEPKRIPGGTLTGWLFIVLGGAFQIGWAIGLDYTDSFTDIMWDAIVIVFLILSMLCLSWAMKSGIQMSTAYAVWIGIGVVGTIITSAILGIEIITVPMALALMLIVAGVVGLKLTG